MSVSSPLALEIAETAARLIVEEGLEWGPAKRRAVRQLGLPQRTPLPDNDQVEAAVREYIELFCADTQPQEPEVPAEGETGSGDTAGEAPSISLPTQEEVEQAASSIYNAASSIWGAIQDAASQQNDAA